MNMNIKYGSLCSGIEAATVAWDDLGWQPQFFSDIEKFPNAVLDHHYPNVPNYGDMTNFGDWPDESINLLVGGTPCQSFSVAGLRGGLDDPRGNLALTYLAIAERYAPRWIVWENVPGVLSSRGGRDFGSFLGALGKLGYGFAYRVLDAQFFGVAQRRRRVFVVGYLGDWRRAAAVLFEPESRRRDTAPSREKKCGAPKGIAERSSKDIWPKEVACTLDTSYGSHYGQNNQHINNGAPLFVASYSDTLSAHGGHRNEVSTIKSQTVTYINGVRRLTPKEFERLQGFPDGYTDIYEKTPDGARYKALGNSMAVPVMKWIGNRIDQIDNL